MIIVSKHDCNNSSYPHVLYKATIPISLASEMPSPCDCFDQKMAEVFTMLVLGSLTGLAASASCLLEGSFLGCAL